MRVRESRGRRIKQLKGRCHAHRRDSLKEFSTSATGQEPLVKASVWLTSAIDLSCLARGTFPNTGAGDAGAFSRLRADAHRKDRAGEVLGCDHVEHVPVLRPAYRFPVFVLLLEHVHVEPREKPIQLLARVK